MKFFLSILLFLAFNVYSQTADFKINGTLCSSDTIFFTNTSTGTYSLSHWTFGDGTDTWTDNPKHIYANDGNYTVTLTIKDDLGNSSQTSSIITINPKPNVYITSDQTSQTLTAHTSIQNVTFLWIYNNDTTNFTDTTIFYYVNGIYTVIATTPAGCSASAQISINSAIQNTTNDSLKINVVNNILTPDIKDGINDVLYIQGLENYTNPCNIKIYSSTGKLIYSNPNYSNLDGFSGLDNNNNPLKAGTYYYIITSKGKKTTTGFIDLIR